MSILQATGFILFDDFSLKRMLIRLKNKREGLEPVATFFANQLICKII